MSQNNMGYNAVVIYTSKESIKNFNDWEVLSKKFHNKNVNAIITLRHEYKVYRFINLTDNNIELYSLNIEDIEEIQVFNESESFSAELSDSKLCGLYRIDNVTEKEGYSKAEYVEADLLLINIIKQKLKPDVIDKLKTRTYINYHPLYHWAEFENMRYVEFKENKETKDSEVENEESKN